MRNQLPLIKIGNVHSFPEIFPLNFSLILFSFIKIFSLNLYGWCVIYYRRPLVAILYYLETKVDRPF